MAGWHHWLDGCECEWTLGVGDGQGGLEWCNSWGHTVGHDWATELNWTELNWDNPNLCGKEIHLIIFLSQKWFLIGCLYTISFSIYLLFSEWRKNWFFCWGYTWASSFLSYRWVIIPFIGENNEAQTLGCKMYLVVLKLKFKCSQFPKDSMTYSDVSYTLYLLPIMASFCRGSNIDLHSTELEQILLHFLIILMSSCYVSLNPMLPLYFTEKLKSICI